MIKIVLVLNEDTLRRLILQLCCFAIVLTANAQTSTMYSGKVVDMGKGISGVQISLINSDKYIAITDSAGDFSFNSGEKVFRFSMLGYYDLEITLKESFNTISLVKEINLLDQVVISEGKTEKAIKRTTVTMEIIQPKLLTQTAPPQIQESINRINGVQIVDNQANIRSGSGWSYGAGSRVQVLVNDIPMLSGDAAQAQWSFIPTEGIERIEIIKGASSVIYGSSALNGVINIKTKSYALKEMTMLSLSTGVFDLPERKSLRYNGSKRANISNLSAFHLGKLNELDFTLGLNMLYDEGFKMNDGEQRGRTNFSLRKVNAKNNSVLGFASAIQMGKSSSFLLWENYPLGYTSLDSGNTRTNSFRFSFDPYYHWQKNKNSHKLLGRYLKVSNSVDNGDTSVDQSNFSDLVYTEYQFKRTISSLDLQILAGIVGQFSITKSPLFNGKQETSNAAAYFQLEKSWNKLLINGGVRAERYSLNNRVESKPVFRAGANYELSKSTFLRTSIGQGFRFPSVAETFITTTVGPVTILPNIDLKSEQGYSWEIGLKQGIKVKKLKALYDFAYFEMHFDRMTEFLFAQWNEFKSFSDIGAGFKAVNAGKTKVSGIESSIGVQYEGPLGSISGFIGYNYTKAISLEPDSIIGKDFYGEELTYSSTSSNKTDNFLKYRPKHSVKMDVIWEYKKLNLGYGFSWQTETVNIDTAFISLPISFFVPGVDSAMNLGITAFFLQNIRLGYSVNSRLGLNLIISNITNREFMIRPADLGAPRSIRFQISYTFQ